MPPIKIELMTTLSAQTGASLFNCKKALEATGGQLADAVLWLNDNGLNQSQNDDKQQRTSPRPTRSFDPPTPDFLRYFNKSSIEERRTRLRSRFYSKPLVYAIPVILFCFAFFADARPLNGWAFLAGCASAIFIFKVRSDIASLQSTLTLILTAETREKERHDNAIASPPEVESFIAAYETHVAAFLECDDPPALPFDTKEYKDNDSWWALDKRAQQLIAVDKELSEYHDSVMVLFNNIISSIRIIKDHGHYCILSAEHICQTDTSSACDFPLPANIMAIKNFTYPKHLTAKRINASTYDVLNRGAAVAGKNIGQGNYQAGLAAAALSVGVMAFNATKMRRELAEIEGIISLYHADISAKNALLRTIARTNISMWMAFTIDALRNVDRMNRTLRSRSEISVHGNSPARVAHDDISALKFEVLKARKLLSIEVG